MIKWVMFGTIHWLYYFPTSSRCLIIGSAIGYNAYTFVYINVYIFNYLRS
jgi:hypothetical protein